MSQHLHKRVLLSSVIQVLRAVLDRQVSVSIAAKSLGLSLSRTYVLLQRYRSVRGSELEKSVHWLYQRDNLLDDQMPESVRSFLHEELLYIGSESPFLRGHFNFQFLAELCEKIYKKRFHRNTVRRWAIRHGYFDPQIHSTGKPLIRFEMSAIGILFQHDSSHHAWLPLTKRMDTLILTEDDHSRKVVGALLVSQDNAWNHLRTVRSTVEMFGCPVAYYCDNHAIFRPQTHEHTQFSRALAALKINLKFTAKAHPQAKGKIEKRFDYFQRRLPYICERYRITNLTKANQILRDLVDQYNQRHIHAETKETPDARWLRALKDGRSMLSPIPNQVPLDLVFALHYQRYVGTDGRLEFGAQHWTIPNAPVRKYVTVILCPPTTLRERTQIFVQYEGSTLAHFVLDHQQFPPDSRISNR